jgi:hypothetical protein
MQSVRFFEDREGPPSVNDGRRLVVGIATCEESWAVDGGRREAVWVATTADAELYPAAYAAYYESFAAGPDTAAATTEAAKAAAAAPRRK